MKVLTKLATTILALTTIIVSLHGMQQGLPTSMSEKVINTLEDFVTNNNLEGIKTHLAQFDIHAGDQDGTTILHLAAHHAKPDLITLLVNTYQADPNKPDADLSWPKTPLMTAVHAWYQCAHALRNKEKGNAQLAAHLAQLEATIIRLVEVGAEINPTYDTFDDWKQCPLHYAVSRNIPCVDLVKTLIKAGASPLADAQGHSTPLHQAVLTADHPLKTEDFPEYKEVARLLAKVALYKQLPLEDGYGRTPLDLARHPELIAVLKSYAIQSGSKKKTTQVVVLPHCITLTPSGK